MINPDRAIGAAKATFGKAEKEIGTTVGDASTAASGAAAQAAGVIQNAAGQVKDGIKETAESVASASSAAYDRGSELVTRSPGSALLMAGFVGFALGVIFAKGSQPKRNGLQRYYDRYGR